MKIEYRPGSVSNFRLGGFATGNYSCTCYNCKCEFTGDKRAVQCLACAIKYYEGLAQTSEGEAAAQLKEDLQDCPTIPTPPKEKVCLCEVKRDSPTGGSIILNIDCPFHGHHVVV